MDESEKPTPVDDERKITRRKFLRFGAIGLGGVAGWLAERRLRQLGLWGESEVELLIKREGDPVTVCGEVFRSVIESEGEGLARATLKGIAGVEKPLDRPIYWGFTPDNQDWNPDLDSIQETMRMAEKSGAIVQFYQDWRGEGEGSLFQEEWLRRIQELGGVPMITWMPEDVRDRLSAGRLFEPQEKFALRRIAEGEFDEYISQWARSAADYGEPFLLRWAHEMNGNNMWPFPWVTGTYGNRQYNTPEEYAQAWRHIHDIFKREGATNVLWVWCPDTEGDLGMFDSLYPGDEYVDWVGLDGYNWGEKGNHGWRTFREIFQSGYNRALEVAPQKPILVAEFGSKGDGDQKARWMAETFGVDIPYLFPQIQAVVYFNKDKKDEGNNWLVDSSRVSKEALRWVLKSTFYRDKPVIGDNRLLLAREGSFD